MAACGGKKDAKTSGNQASDNSTINLSVDEGTLKYIGAEKATEGLVSSNKDIDFNKVILIKFEYTNKQEDPSECQDTFYIQTFQNGTEISDSLSFSGDGGEQYELVNNFFSEVLTGGTITFARMVMLKDDSPLTIIAKERGKSDSKKQTMEIDVSSIISATAEPAEDKQSTEAESKDESDESEAAENKDVAKPIAIGEKIETADFDFTLNKVELTYEVTPEDTSSVYSSYEAESGKVFVHVDGSYYNKSKRDACIRDLFVPTANYDNGYIYEGFAAVDNGNKFDWVSSYVICTPLETCHYHGIIECPEVVATTAAPLKVNFEIDGTVYEAIIR